MSSNWLFDAITHHREISAQALLKRVWRKEQFE